jgi:hypothetical protein
MSTGKRNIIGQKQKLQGRHKEEHVFPINLMVAEVPGGGRASRNMPALLLE